MVSLSPPTNLRESSSWTPLQGAILLLLAAVSIYNFVRRDPTAFEWPAIDMGCFFERQADPAFLSNDYFTNSVAQPNPRHVFGYLVLGLSTVLRTDWYGALFALRSTLTVALPVLWYLALWGMIRPRLTRERAVFITRFALCLAIILVMRRDVRAWFSIAWWPPIEFYAGAHPTSQAVSLLAVVLRTAGRNWAYRLSFPMWFCAAMIHPAMALFVLTFYWLWAFNWGRRWELTADLAVAVVLPFGLLWFSFGATSPLPAEDFVYYYAHVSHPFHYIVSEFETLTRHPWWVSFGLILFLLVFETGFAAWKGNRRLLRSTGWFFLAYAGCVVLQYLSTEVWPSRFLTILGPSRFSILGYFMVALVATEIFATYWPTKMLGFQQSHWSPNLYAWFKPWHVAATLIVATLSIYGLFRDHLQIEIRASYAGLYNWIGASTNPDDVFIVPFDTPLHRELPIIGKRAVYASQSFPFREETLREHFERYRLAYGELEELVQVEGKDLVRRRLQFGRELNPSDYVRLADRYRLDYVVVEADQPTPLSVAPACYSDASVAVYSVKELRRRASFALPLDPSVAHERAGASALR